MHARCCCRRDVRRGSWRAEWCGGRAKHRRAFCRGAGCRHVRRGLVPHADGVGVILLNNVLVVHCVVVHVRGRGQVTGAVCRHASARHGRVRVVRAVQAQVCARHDAGRAPTERLGSQRNQHARVEGIHRGKPRVNAVGVFADVEVLGDSGRQFRGSVHARALLKVREPPHQRVVGVDLEDLAKEPWRDAHNLVRVGFGRHGPRERQGYLQVRVDAARLAGAARHVDVTAVHRLNELSRVRVSWRGA